MAESAVFDVVIIGGGLAGSALAGALAAANLGVLVVEREEHFRDRVRGEATWPWGVAELRTLGLLDLFHSVGISELKALTQLENKTIVNSYTWEPDPQIGFSHPLMQEALFARAAQLGATTLRPAKATAVTPASDGATVTVELPAGTAQYRTRLVVCADGKTSPGRRWTGGESATDPLHHRFGGVLLTGMETDPHALLDATTPELATFWFPIGPTGYRLYLRQTDEQLRENKADRSLDAFLATIGPYTPDGTLDHVEQAGPLAFFANSCTWATRIAGDHIVLIGDAAGSVDPTVGHGTSLTFRDVRELRDLLLNEPDWTLAIREFARRRSEYYAPLRAADNWFATITAETGPDADRRRERHNLARENDPTLGGFGLIEERGPDGLVPDESARRHYFGEDL